MSVYLGLDSSTQSLSVVAIETVSGEILAKVSANFGEVFPEFGMPSGFAEGEQEGEVYSNPLMWLKALDRVLSQLKESGFDFSQVVAVSGSGQQHGSVYLRKGFSECLGELKPEAGLADQLEEAFSRLESPIWMDTSTTSECLAIAEALGGQQEVCRRSGSVATERFTGPQFKKAAEKDSQTWSETAEVHLVSSFLASVLAGKSVAIDFGDGAGMNLMNLANEAWDADLVAATAPDLANRLPELKASGTVAGPVGDYFVHKYGFASSCQVVLWSGDNPCSLVGMGAGRPGRLVISLGTSDTLFAAMPEACTDPNGYGHVFGNPLGGYMSLICFRNGSLAREAVKDRFDLSWDDFDAQGLARTPAGNEGRVFLPFIGDEITPRLSSGDAVALGWDGEPTADESVRGVLEGQFLNMKIHARWMKVETEEILLTGGASNNDGIAQIVANVFGKKVRRLEVSDSAAIGAAMRAAVACGENVVELEGKFSAPAGDRDILPELALLPIYEQLEDVFLAGLKQNYNL